MPNTGHYALLIGVKDYLDTKKHGLGNLGSPANDITSLHEWLTDPAFGDVPEGNCIVLHSDPSFSPHHDEINAAIDQLRWEADNNKGGGAERIYFYFSGHGFGLWD